DQRLLVDLTALEPVEIVGQVDDNIRTVVVEQLGEAGGIPALGGWTGCEEADVFFGTQADERLAQGIAAAQQHQAHSHSVASRTGYRRRSCHSPVPAVARPDAAAAGPGRAAPAAGAHA